MPQGGMSFREVGIVAPMLLLSRRAVTAPSMPSGGGGGGGGNTDNTACVYLYFHICSVPVCDISGKEKS